MMVSGLMVVVHDGQWSDALFDDGHWSDGRY